VEARGLHCAAESLGHRQPREEARGEALPAARLMAVNHGTSVSVTVIPLGELGTVREEEESLISLCFFFKKILGF
jgi:hypothetical protein